MFGDYDVDGATSAALLLRFFRAVGGEASVYVPDRLREGYGPNAPALLRLKAEGAGIVVTVDCGATRHARRQSGHTMARLTVSGHSGDNIFTPINAPVYCLLFPE